MIGLPTGTKVWLAAGVTDMRMGMHSLMARAQTVLQLDPFSGHVFCYRGRRGDLVKVIWWSGDGTCLFVKRLESAKFVWPKNRERCRKPVAGAAVDAARRNRLEARATVMEATQRRMILR